MGGGQDQVNPKYQDLSKSAFSEGKGEGEGVVVQTESTQSAKICPNLHVGLGGCRPTKPKVPKSVQICILGEWRGGEGGGPDQLNPKWQDLSKSAFLRGRGWWSRLPDQLKPKCQDLSISAFSEGPHQLNQNCQDLSKSAFLGWGGG